MLANLLLDISPGGWVFIVIIGLVVLKNLGKKVSVVKCMYRGWKGSEKKWQSNGDSCPFCLSDLGRTLD
jgi:hypothetical protein